MSLFAFLLGQSDKKYVFNGYEAVDIGVRADNGKRLLFATCNIGANSPEEIGDLFAWGETESKDEYTWENYKWASSVYRDVPQLEKYTKTSRIEGDGKTELDLEDDAAHINLGNDWRMLTYSELERTINNCNIVENNSGVLTIIGNNNLINIPSNIWTKSLGLDQHCWGAWCLQNSSFSLLKQYRNVGTPIRPVIELDNPTEIYYTTSDELSIESNLYLNSMGLVSNTYENGLGILKFSGSITSLPMSCFTSKTLLTSITLPDSITTIGDSAFYNCRALTTINIPNSVTTIGDYAFAFDNGLRDINYSGTLQQWQAIIKEATWKSSVYLAVVHCTDGDIAIDDA